MLQWLESSSWCWSSHRRSLLRKSPVSLNENWSKTHLLDAWSAYKSAARVLCVSFFSRATPVRKSLKMASHDGTSGTGTVVRVPDFVFLRLNLLLGWTMPSS